MTPTPTTFRRTPTLARGLALLALTALAACGGGDEPAADSTASNKPNILFVVMDDVGIDQMASFGYGGDTPPSMPNIDAVAQAGVKFRNTWSMPECSPGRAAFFAGRYPLRTHMYQALGPKDLANSQLAPDDVTTPKLLKRAGYVNGLFGKFHLAGPDHNEAGSATPLQLGWDYFYGWVGGLPGSIDTSAGGAYADSSWSCGFYPHHFEGACHHADGTCTDMSAPALEGNDSSGLQCLNSGGIFVDHKSCSDGTPAGLNFNKENAYYVSPLVIEPGEDGQPVEEVPLSDSRARGYRTTIETDAAIKWIKARPAGQPWMATVSYSAAHTPWQPAPMALTPQTGPQISQMLPDAPNFSGNIIDCGSTVAGRVIQNQMTEAMDTEFGRLLVETGLATRNADGTLAYDPKASNTVIVIVGDNGSLGYAAKTPFDPSYAKGTSYQGGVWVPLVVAGPQVAQPGREVDHMVNTVDLFQFFGELAGLDAHKEVPRTVDSVALLPYLESPGQASLRTVNFTQSGVNLQANDGRNGPCVMNRDAGSGDGGSCTQIPTSKSVCEDNGGVWWGQGYTDASVVPNGGAGYARCWQVNQAIYKNDAGAPWTQVLPESSVGIRDDHYKIVRNTVVDYDLTADDKTTTQKDEFYEVDEAKWVRGGSSPKLEDPAANDLLKGTLDAGQQSAYDTLKTKMNDILASEPDCPGDGNKDGKVDAVDLANVQRIMSDWGLSSVYDFVVDNVLDGKTDANDLAIVQNNMNTTCPKSHAVY